MKNQIVQIDSVEFQRNGIGGAPFATVRFISKSDSGKLEPLIATFESDDPMRTRVIHATNPSEAYRGDVVARWLKEKLFESHPDLFEGWDRPYGIPNEKGDVCEVCEGREVVTAVGGVNLCDVCLRDAKESVNG